MGPRRFVIVAVALALIAPFADRADAGGTANFTLSPSSNNFGSIEIGGSASQSFTLTNIGGASTGTYQSSSVSGNGFDLNNSDCANKLTLQTNESCSIVVTFEPTVPGPDSGTLSVTTSTNDPTAGVSGTGVPDTRIDSFRVIHARRKAKATFSSSAAGATFECSLDSAAPGPCDSPAVFKRLKVGRHTLEVTAVHSTGPTSDPTPAVREFRVRRV